MKKILVIGSVNMDLVTYVKKVPVAGETIMGTSFCQNPGGKGANQAAAAALAGAYVSQLAKIGNDDNGKALEKILKEKGVHTRFIIDENESTGIASIIIEEETGENRIIVVGGANIKLDIKDIDDNIDLINEADIILMQLEIPMQTVEYVASLAHKLGKMVILNPAPAKKLSCCLLKNIDYLTPNETELSYLCDGKDLTSACEYMLKIGVKNLIVTLGKNGSILVNKNGIKKIDAYPVKAIDTTGAGDCFNGVFTAFLSKGLNEVEALKYASYAASISVTRNGAIPSLPNIEEILKIK